MLRKRAWNIQFLLTALVPIAVILGVIGIASGVYVLTGGRRRIELAAVMLIPIAFLGLAALNVWMWVLCVQSV